MPLVLAHRGANKRAPQNTLPAFRKAVEFNADGIETDVHLSKDGEIVICHNYTIDATSNGEGLIRDYTCDELKKFDFGSYFSDEFKGVTLPTLSEALDIVKDMQLINIEIKAPQVKNDLVKRTVDMVQKYGLRDRVIISCFNPECIRESKEIDPGIRTGLLYENDDLGKEIMAFGVEKYCAQLNANAAHPGKDLITEEEVKRLHEMNMMVNVWTVNEKEDILRLTEWGCDALISDIPDFVMSVLQNR
ncbi:MAG: glycerophosphodiester phosphodiesterase [Ruminococcaceae bacterium]|jgi:glycerophosphoryl diester phosphodiesterase|nr:glycerophosphodiester phosphodiesterase [Oscillospiraceae bacterium]